MTPVLYQTLRKERRAITGWTIGVVLIVAITLGSWPGIAESSADFEQLFDNLPDALTAFFGEGIANFSAAGIVGSRLFGTIGLALFISYAVSRGARGIGGEQEQGTLELLVVSPHSRAAIAVDKAVAVLVGVTALIGLELALVLVLMPVVGLDFGLGNVVLAAVGLLLLAAMFGAVAFAVGAVTGSRSRAVGVAGGAAGALFLLTGFGGLVEGLETVAELSPFSHYDGSVVLQDGLSPWVLVVFALVAVAFCASGIAGFARRDLS